MISTDCSMPIGTSRPWSKASLVFLGWICHAACGGAEKPLGSSAGILAEPRSPVVIPQPPDLSTQIRGTPLALFVRVREGRISENALERLRVSIELVETTSQRTVPVTVKLQSADGVPVEFQDGELYVSAVVLAIEPLEELKSAWHEVRARAVGDAFMLGDFWASDSDAKLARFRFHPDSHPTLRHIRLCPSDDAMLVSFEFSEVVGAVDYRPLRDIIAVNQGSATCSDPQSGYLLNDSFHSAPSSRIEVTCPTIDAGVTIALAPGLATTEGVTVTPYGSSASDQTLSVHTSYYDLAENEGSECRFFREW